ncbi:lysine exporter LysO family protein [Mycobacterium szulgai]|nr:lysine exporter LysO family protein [Mycobacterium szulgai]
MSTDDWNPIGTVIGSVLGGAIAGPILGRWPR